MNFNFYRFDKKVKPVNNVWTEKQLTLLKKEADKNLYCEDFDLLQKYSIEWNRSYEDIVKKVQEIRASQFNGDYSAWYIDQARKLGS